MRRLLSIAAFSLVLAVPMWAQRGGHGGGHAGGSGFGGRGGGHLGGGRLGGHSFGGMHSGGMRSGPGFSRGFNHFNRGFNRTPLMSGFRGHRHHGFNNFALRNNCIGFGCRNWGWSYPWWGWGYNDPLWWSWNEQDRRFDDDYYRQYEIANEMNRQSLEQQRMWRQEEADGDQDAYAPQPSSGRPAAQSPAYAPDPVPTTVLVYRDQHRQEIQNYAIAGQTLWAYSAGRTQRIPLSDLDVAATEKANDDRGVTFRVPGANEGQ